MVIKNFYEKFLTLSTNEREMKNEEKKNISSQELFRKVFFSSEKRNFSDSTWLQLYLNNGRA